MFGTRGQLCGRYSAVRYLLLNRCRAGRIEDVTYRSRTYPLFFVPSTRFARRFGKLKASSEASRNGSPNVTLYANTLLLTCFNSLILGVLRLAVYQPYNRAVNLSTVLKAGRFGEPVNHSTYHPSQQLVTLSIVERPESEKFEPRERSNRVVNSIDVPADDTYIKFPLTYGTPQASSRLFLFSPC